jgi:1-aminocyclopropane-1-carboxylate deaminase
MQFLLPSPISKIHLPLLQEKEIELYLKRDDLIHDVVSGNKWRKLKYNIEFAQKNDVKTILTFGGAYSNHIIATAFACKENGLKSIGIIRGDDPSVLLAPPKRFAKASRTSPLGKGRNEKLNETLEEAQQYGMQLHFISREEYKRKEEKDFIQELKNKSRLLSGGEFYLIEEGGANQLGIEGCKEILLEESVVEHGRNHRYDYITCAAGTGTTLTGLLLSLRENEKLLGFPALKGGEFLKEVIEKNIIQFYPSEKNKMSSLELICDYHFGGYAKVNDELKNFVSDFFKQTQIQLDLIYNGKMMFGLIDLIQKDYFPKKSKILAIHTGGVQGNRGFL